MRKHLHLGVVLFIGSAVAPSWGQCEIDTVTAWDGGNPGDRFSEGVVISDDFMVIGTPFDDFLGNNAGSAYVFRWDGTSFAQQVRLNPADAQAGDCFGMEVGLDGDWLAVGAPHHDSTRGAVYVYRWDGQQWIEMQKLFASDGTADEWFGAEVELLDDLLVIGTPRADALQGAAYVFRRAGDTWIEETKLVASDGIAGDQFGWAVPHEDDRIVVGAPFDDSRRGSVYVYHFDGENWNEEVRLEAGDRTVGDHFGEAVSIHDELIAIGAYGDDDLGGSSGSVYLFSFDGLDWSELTKIHASDGAAEDHFGRRGVVFDPTGNLLAVGAPQRDLSDAPGKAYLFQNDDGEWVEVATLTASDAMAGDDFGYKLALTDRFVVVGAQQFGTSGSGKAHVFAIGLDDCNGNGTPDECEQLCAVDEDCDDADDCTVDTCDCENPEAEPDACVHDYRPRLFGDIVPPLCTEPPDQPCPQPNLDDILCVLDDFADGTKVSGCGDNDPPESTDLCPCGGDGQIDLDDVLCLLDAFAGLPPCPDPCPG